MAPDLLLPGDEPGLSPLALQGQAEEQPCPGTAGTEVLPSTQHRCAAASAATRFLSENGGRDSPLPVPFCTCFWEVIKTDTFCQMWPAVGMGAGEGQDGAVTL